MSQVNFYSFIFVFVLLLGVWFHYTPEGELDAPIVLAEAETTSITSVRASNAAQPIQAQYLASAFAVSQARADTYTPIVSTEPPPLDVSAALAQEIGKQFPLFEFNTSQYWPIASITKLMTAIVAYERIGEDTVITLSQTAIDKDGTAGNLEVGDEYSVWRLVELMMIASSNDAAQAIAEHYGEEAFVEAMRAKARELGMRDTYFVESTGLSTANQSTVADVRKLTTYVYDRYPVILKFSTKESIIRNGQKVKNINLFAGDRDFIGGKTGFLEESQGNLVSLFTFKNRTFLIVVFGATDRFTETEKIYDWIKSLY